MKRQDLLMYVSACLYVVIYVAAIFAHKSGIDAWWVYLLMFLAIGGFALLFGVGFLVGTESGLIRPPSKGKR